MKLVLLPGMDGTGQLFREFLLHYQGDYSVIALPEYGDQTYAALAKYVADKLPKEDHVILAESFSGGIVPFLLRESNINIKGIIFVASFLSCPRPMLVSMARFLPLKWLAILPGADLLHKRLFLGNNINQQALGQFKAIIAQASSTVLRNRLKSMLSLVVPDEGLYSIPCVYIKPTNDVLVATHKMAQISKVFTDFSSVNIEGSHFILQAAPEESANIVAQFMRDITQMDRFWS